MINSPILDLAIAMSFTYFVLSLVVSTIHEYIFSVLKSKRADYLKKALEDLFFDSDWQKFTREKLIKSRHLEALMACDSKENVGKFPSYIPAENFALAIMDSFRKGNTLVDMQQIKDILLDDEKAETYGIKGDLRKALISFYERSNIDLTAFQQNIENYFDKAMDRAAGVYKRSTRNFMLLISIIVASALNADSVHIAKTMWENPEALKQTTGDISGIVERVKNESGKFTIDTIYQEGDKVTLQTKTKKEDIAKPDTSSTKRSVEEIKKTIIHLNQAGIPLGWKSSDVPSGSWCNIFLGWLIKLCGIFLTATALMLGAPFWFDLINKFINIRATGKKEESKTTEQQAREAKPNPITVNINPGGEAVG
jgi:hypothetical protein